MRKHHLLTITFAAGLVALAPVGAPVAAQSFLEGEVASGLMVQPLSSEARPVLASDGKIHVAYELIISNPGNIAVMVDTVTVTDPQGRAIKVMSKDDIARMTRSYSGAKGFFGAGEGRILFLDVTFNDASAVPASLGARIDISRAVFGPDGKRQPYPAAIPFAEHDSFTTTPIVLKSAARLVAPPLRGKNWVVVNGCCDSVGAHRGALIPTNGELYAPQRFAIDFVQLDNDRKLFTGPSDKRKSYAFFGDDVLSVADGTVINVHDGEPEQVPDKPATGVTPAGLGGNIVVVDIGGGAFAYYAHLQPGSPTVKVGDKVTAGQVLGKLGNTGNSSAPHLHFHLIDGPSPINSSGIPYLFTSFTSEGRIATEEAFDAMFEGKAVAIDRSAAANKQAVFPLDHEIISFGD